jgi:diguanylate cyclase (GGDEF)-like protein
VFAISNRVAVTDTSAALRTLLSEAGSDDPVPAGSLLWKEGEPGDEVVLVRDGTLQVLHQDGDGEPVILRELPPGSVLGEIACLDGRPRSATVRARTDCRLARVPAARFRELLRQHPSVLEALLLQQVQLVRNLTAQVTRTHRRAITDAMTRLYNVGFFTERLALELERARVTGDPVSLVIFDVDHFKNYNDTQGHQEGSTALVRVAEILRSTGRRGDVIARYGGEEFVVLLYGAGTEEARRFGEVVRTAVEASSFPGGPQQPLGCLTISGGVATFPKDATSSEELLAAADHNLYAAKQTGRNRIVASAAV